ncbi:serine/threonine protein kinase [Paludisphaera mucosa]|uniref:Protein kinase n=1 Tax=Paludisphaera mucosa TaxID=3030827 RepID=A0ABT6FL55_9BACT|nr:serine/threonine protein kinase [Paludisphaera mucosa]MDG3008299.1 protein kinase [Paludisphaera mucosa]
MDTTIDNDPGAGRVRELFEGSADLPPEEWEPFLQRQCPDDPGIRAEVLRILQSDRHPEIEAFLRRQAAGGPDTEFESIGKYREVRRFSRSGGQGTAYLALDPDLRRHVVLKRYHAGAGATPAAIAEARSLAQVQSPYVARCYGIERHGDEAFLVVEYIPGRNLDEIRRDGPMGWGRVVGIASRLAEGVAAVHARGLVHRDIKPANIVLHEDVTPHLIDFGLASHLGGDRLRELGGTPQYMAPEQARGEWDRIDFRTDVYGMGAVLYHLLTGRPPFAGRTQSDALAMAREGRVVPPRRINARVPRSLERICLKALAPHPGQRYASADEFRKALGGPRRRVLSAALSLAGLAVLAVAIAVVIRGRDRPRASAATPPALTPAASSEGGPLKGQLQVRIYTPDRLQGRLGLARHGVPLDAPGALPVRQGEQVQLEATAAPPAYLYLIWIDSRGHIDPLYPWSRRFDEAMPPVGPVSRVRSPSESDRGWPLEGPGGQETAVLLARRSPLPSDVKLADLLEGLPPTPAPDPGRLLVVRSGPPEGVAGAGSLQRTRSLGQQSETLDEPLMQLLARLRPHFELIEAYRFAYRSDVQ